MSDYNELLREAYRGELLGREVFAAMATRPEFSEHVAKIRTMSEIEARTAQTLRPLVDAAGIDRSDDKSAEALGRELGEAGGDWNGFLHALHDALPKFLADFVRLRELADDPHDPALHALVEHEQTINAFTELELAGCTDISHAVLTRYLETAP
jgi:hypothetical protein